MIHLRLSATLTQLGLALLVSGAGLTGAPSASAATCTDGVNCYCDTVSDTKLLMCEDFEAKDYYENTSADWAATASGSGNRGDQSRWGSLYGNGGSGSLFRSSDPSPRIAPSCGYPDCTGMREYCSTAQGNVVDGRGADCWGPGANNNAHLDVQRAGDFRAEVSSLSLSGGRGETSDVGGGRQHLALRIAPGMTAGIMGSTRFTQVTEVGITMALAYSSNTGSTNILKAPWKHDEWYGSTSGNGYWEHWNLGITGSAGLSQFPYSPFMFTSSQSACSTALSRASILVGTAQCSSVALQMGASSAVYSQSRDFPFGTWGCHQAHISGMGTSSMTLKIWHNGNLVFHLANFDGRSALKNQNYSGFYWNSYSNANQGQGAIPTTATSYRYQDNMHVRNGPPVACSAIGFDGTPSPSDPPPTGLQAPILLP